MNILKRSAKAVITGITGFFILSLIGGIMLKITPMPEDWGFGYLIFCISLIAMAEGAYMAAGTEKGGLISGILTALVLIILIFSWASLLFSGTADFASLMQWQYVIPLLAGAVGGIIGINVKK